MKKMLMLSFFTTMLFCLVCHFETASAAIVNFDDYPNQWISDQYSDLGINFDHAYARGEWNQTHAPYKYPGDVAATSSGGQYENDSSIFEFDFVLGSFDLLVDNSFTEDSFLTLSAYDIDGNLVATNIESIPTDGQWHLMTIGLSGVSATTIELTGHPWQYGFDNITFSAVPIPSSILMFAFGLSALVGLRAKISVN